MQNITVGWVGAARVFVVDFSSCEPGTYAPVVQEAQDVLCRQPLRSVRVVTVFQDVTFDMGTVKEMQQYASTVMPHLKKCALVGIDGMKKVVFGGIKPLFTIPVELFKDVEAARQWVAQG
jgi:hypothetical protein